MVAAADETHHLSCQVTIAGDGGSATATSGFDAIPAQRGGKIVESFVGTAKDSARRTVQAPVTCSPQAAGQLHLHADADRVADRRPQAHER